MLTDAEHHTATGAAEEAASLCSIANSWGDEDATAKTQITPREAAHRAGLARIAAASDELNARLSLEYETTWEYVAAKYEAAMLASDVCDDVYPDAVFDDADEISEASAPIFAVLHNALDDLSETDAPDWPGLALKARALVGHYDTGRETRWAKAALAFADNAEALGSGPREDLNFFDVLQARGHAEKMAYHMAHDRDGYAGWACFGGAIAAVAKLVETIVRESRDFAQAAPAQKSISALVMGAVWFGEIPGEKPQPKRSQCEADRASDLFSTALRIHAELDGKRGATDDEKARCEAAWQDMMAAEEEAEKAEPLSRSGVGFQLMVAAGHLDCVEAGKTDEIKADHAERIKTILANAIKALGLPFDYRVAEYYLGARLGSLDGKARKGVA